MTALRSSAIALVTSIALGILSMSSLSVAHADDDTTSVPCADQQAQVERATGKLAALTVKFTEHPTAKNLKAKKAQVQRVTHATDRLEACSAGTTDEPTDD